MHSKRSDEFTARYASSNLIGRLGAAYDVGDLKVPQVEVTFLGTNTDLIRAVKLASVVHYQRESRVK